MTQPHEIFDPAPFPHRGFVYIVLGLALLATWGLVSHADYVEQREMDCIQRDMEYNAARDECVRGKAVVVEPHAPAAMRPIPQQPKE